MVDGVVDIPLPGRMLESDDPNVAMAASHFVAGPENRLVEVVVRRVVEQEPNGCNPLVLFGPSGTGKSHLAHGLAAAWKARQRQAHDEHDEHVARQRVVCTTAVDLRGSWPTRSRPRPSRSFVRSTARRRCWSSRTSACWPRGNWENFSAQEELIHTLDALVAEDRWVIITASAAPAELPGIMPALQSRLTAGLTIPLSSPGPEARLAILRQLAARGDWELSKPAARALAEGFRGSVPELAGLLLELEMPTQLEHGQVDLPMVKQYLAQRDRADRPTVREIALQTARHFSLTLADLRSPLRHRALVTARNVAVYLARQLTDESLERIGKYFGGRDHTTVMHGCRQIEKLLESDPAVRRSVDLLKRSLWKT